MKSKGQAIYIVTNYPKKEVMKNLWETLLQKHDYYKHFLWIETSKKAALKIKEYYESTVWAKETKLYIGKINVELGDELTFSKEESHDI